MRIRKHAAAVKVKNGSQGDGRILALYLKDITNIPLLTVEEERELGRRIREGDKEALKKLVESNLRFVIKIAKKYANYGMALIDLVNEGNLGLMEAAKRFDPARNVRFTSYAVWWIRQAILKYFANNRLIYRTAPRTAQINYQAALALARHKNEANEPVELKTLAEEIGVSENELKNALAAVRETISLEEPATNCFQEYDLLLKDVIPDTKSSPEEEVVDSERRQLLENALKALGPKEEKIMRLRFGFDGPELTLFEIGKQFGLSRERIRQIEKKSLDKIKRLQSLVSFRA